MHICPNIEKSQDRNEKDAQQYVSELKELQRTLDHDEKLKDFLFSKSNERAFSATHFEEDEKQKGKRAAEEKVRSYMYRSQFSFAAGNRPRPAAISAGN